MRVMRAEPSRFADVTARSVGAVWRAYDLQLTTYAALLGVVRAGHGLHEQRRGRPVDHWTAARSFSRALMWSGLAIVVFIAATAVRLPLAQDAGLADLRS